MEIKVAKDASRGAVLVSGASFAGLATAYWMNELGYEVTLIEIASELRKGGTPIDIEGESIQVLTRMGMIDAVRAKALPPRGLEFKNADGSTVGTIEPEFESGEEKYEIHRDDLLDILFNSIKDTVEILFSCSIKEIKDERGIVTVLLGNDSEREYAMVFGCDGNRSNTRKLVFGDTENFSFYMGGYFFLKVVSNTDILPANVTQVFSEPGRTVLLNGYKDRMDIGFAFRSEHEIEYDYRNRSQQRRMLHDHFDGLGWKVSDLLSLVDTDNEFYFDMLNQIRMPVWFKGRVALVGDAAYCVSPLAGMGGSMAIIGAARLADALRHNEDDYTAAFQEYDDKLRTFVDEVQAKALTFGMAFMFPSDDEEISERNRKLSEGTVEL
jgi:2-polyprenyl-6-methoxyphenol hydroxylase-like FAD-dependent oxidoreductase